MPTKGPGRAPATLQDYEADDVLVVDSPEQLRALAHELRSRIVSLLHYRARSTQELARELGIPKGTIGHHLKVLERAGLIHVVRTRRVRALTEKFYGRTARLFLFQAEDPADERALGATLLQQAARELAAAPGEASFGLPHARLTSADARRFERRLHRLADDFLAAETTSGRPYVFAFGLWPTGPER
jgi:DNA-binding transcriptional ArsR family regulator